MHVTILKFECRSLEPKLSNLLGVCNVLLRGSVQLLHPDRRCNTNWQSAGHTTRVNGQIDSLSQPSVDCIGTQLCRIPTVVEPVSGSVPRLASLVDCTSRVDRHGFCLSPRCCRLMWLLPRPVSCPLWVTQSLVTVRPRTLSLCLTTPVSIRQLDSVLLQVLTRQQFLMSLG